MLIGLVLDGIAVDAWGGCHVQPTFGMQVVVVVNAHEVRLILTRQGDAGRAVGLVADHQVELM